MTAHRRPEIRFSDAPRGTCRWCGEAILYGDGPKRGELDRRRRWHPACVDAWNESDPRLVRRRLRRRDRGVCAACGLDTVALRRRLRGRGMTKALRERGFVPRRSLWEVDHVVPLIDGGSHDLANLQTLCTPCHKAKTAAEATARAARREAPTTPETAPRTPPETPPQTPPEPTPKATTQTTTPAPPAHDEAGGPGRTAARPARKPRDAAAGDAASLDALLARATAVNAGIEATLRAMRERS